MASLTAVELGTDICALARTSIHGGAVRVSDAEWLDPAAFPGGGTFTLALRQSRKRMKLPRRCRVVLWGMPDGASRRDPEVKPRLAPLEGAGFRIERVVSPCNALAALARLKTSRGENATCWLAINRGGVAIVVVRPGKQLYAHSFTWDSTVGATGSQARLLQRYSLVSYLSPEVKRAMARQHGTPVDAIVTCGNLPDLRSMTMPLIEELDVEVETLDSLDGLEVKKDDVDRLAEVAPAIRLACAGAVARSSRPWDKSRKWKTQLERAVLYAAVAGGVLAVGYAWYAKTHAPAPAPFTPSPAPASPPKVSQSTEPRRGAPPPATMPSQPPPQNTTPPAQTPPAPRPVPANLPAAGTPAATPGTPASQPQRSATTPSRPATVAPPATERRPESTPPKPTTPTPQQPTTSAQRQGTVPQRQTTVPPPPPTAPSRQPGDPARKPQDAPQRPAAPAGRQGQAGQTKLQPPKSEAPAGRPASQPQPPRREPPPQAAPPKPAPSGQSQPPRRQPPTASQTPKTASQAPRVNTPAVQADKPGAGKVERPLPPRLQDPVPRITSILISFDRRYATVDGGQIVGIGDILGRRTVVSIDERSVVFREPSGVQIRVGFGGRILGVGPGGP